MTKERYAQARRQTLRACKREMRRRTRDALRKPQALLHENMGCPVCGGGKSMVVDGWIWEVCLLCRKRQAIFGPLDGEDLVWGNDLGRVILEGCQDATFVPLVKPEPGVEPQWTDVF